VQPVLLLLLLAPVEAVVPVEEEPVACDVAPVVVVADPLPPVTPPVVVPVVPPCVPVAPVVAVVPLVAAVPEAVPALAPVVVPPLPLVVEPVVAPPAASSTGAPLVDVVPDAEVSGVVLAPASVGSVEPESAFAAPPSGIP
jgi:hypothetical protein